MGAHVEGPYLHQKHAGTHDPALFVPYSASKLVYGQVAATNETVKVATVAPDIGNGSSLIKDLSSRGIRVSLGHTHATYDMGLEALSSGASCLTNPLTGMVPLNSLDPGPTGLISLPHNHQPPPPYYTIPCDGMSLHPQVAALFFRVNPRKAILASNNAEIGELHPSAGTFEEQQRPGTTATLEHRSFTADQGVRNLMNWSGCTIAEAVRTATENTAEFMGISDRGKLEEGRRADFIVLNDDGYLQETWIAGVKAWSKE
jgi:N-acetylglucosamine-6-phosphate deacetylase